MVFMIDQDVPRNGTTFTLLHWFQTSLHRSMDNASLTHTMVDNGMPTIEGAPYIPPTPPGGSGPHRYNFLLYAQPANFSLPEQYASINPPADTSARIGFNLTAFASAAGLDAPVAANYLRVLNGTEAETSSAETMTGTVGVAPTANPTVTASTTSESTTDTATQSSTGDVSPPTETSSDADTIVLRGSAKDLWLGLAMAALGAGMFLA
jgi:phosphatidylethanolamine-binding protein